MICPQAFAFLFSDKSGPLPTILYMLLLRQGQPNTIIVTLQEKTTLPNAYYLFVFVHITTRSTVQLVKTKADDLSSYPRRYNEYDIDVTLFTNAGQYLYYVYEVAEGDQNVYLVDDAGVFITDDQGNKFITGTTSGGAVVVPLDGLAEVENGRMEVLPQNPFTFRKYEPKATYTAYAG